MDGRMVLACSRTRQQYGVQQEATEVQYCRLGIVKIDRDKMIIYNLSLVQIPISIRHQGLKRESIPQRSVTSTFCKHLVAFEAN